MKDNRPSVLITGCNGGIGNALCETFSSAGYFVIGTDKQVKSEVVSDFYLSCDLENLAIDITTQNSFHHDVTDAVEKLSSYLKVIINNAAVQVVKPIQELSASDFHSTLLTNVLAPYVISKLFEISLRNGTGSIINIGSIHARLSKPGFCAYSTSKTALSGLTRSLALEFSSDITVNTLLPAATKTEMLVAGFKDHPEMLNNLESFHPAGRIAEPIEMAQLALFICSDSARFITGADIPIDGGIGGRLYDPV